jgi:hypothetical protein
MKADARSPFESRKAASFSESQAETVAHVQTVFW